MSKLIIPQTPDLVGSKQKISDFNPVTPQELYVNMQMPIEAALAQGHPVETPIGLPLDAVARMIATIHQMGNTLAQTQTVLETVMAMEDLPEAAKNKLDELFAPKIDLEDLFKKPESKE